jgi:hypothetical protein
MIPLAMSSATVIGLRTWLLWPVEGRHSDWQKREAARMVGEKVEAVREAQAEALALAWRMWFVPWTVWGPLAGRSLSSSMNAATGAMVRPFSRRAAGNASRLQAHAMRTAAQALPAMAALPALLPAAAATPAKRRAKTRATTARVPARRRTAR